MGLSGRFSKVRKICRFRFPSLGKFIIALLLCIKFSTAREVPLTVLYTTDIHGYILGEPTKKEPAGAGGLLRCATLIGQVRAQEKNVLLLDSGDTIQGSAESLLTGGRIMMRAMEWLHYDAWCLGNHDFDWGTALLTNLLATTKLTILAANIAPPLPHVQPFIIKEVDGVRVAIVGLTNPLIPKWTRPELLGEFKFPAPADALTGLLPVVRAAKPDVLLLLIHEGYRPTGDDTGNEIHALAKRFPEFDAILGGHLHEVVIAPQGLGALYLEAGCHGGAVGRVNLTFDTVQQKVIHRAASVLLASNAVPESVELRALLHRDLARAEKYLAAPVGVAATAVAATGKIRGQSPLQQLLCRAIAEKVHADIVLHGTFSESGLAAGPLTMRDIWHIVPYENRIGVAWLTMQEIRTILEENATATGDHFLGVWGVAYDLHPDAPVGERVQNLQLADGTKPHARKRFAVAFNSHTLSSGGGRFSSVPQIVAQPHARFMLTTNDTRTVVADFIRKNSPLKSENPPLVRVVE